MRLQPARETDRVIATLATRQHGVVALRQLRAAGITQSAVSRRVLAGRLHRIHRGVYAPGHPILRREGRWMAAVLAAGPGAALSHAAAGALWELRPSAATKIDVSVRTPGGRAKNSALRIHRTASLSSDEVTIRKGIPVTTPDRTILDLAATLPRRALERLLDQAESTRLTHVSALDARARSHPSHHGAPKLREALDTHVSGTTLTRSDLEERFLAICRHLRLARPRVNATLEGLEVDFLFQPERLVVETDGWRHHRTRSAFERDRERDAILAAAGYSTLRFTDRQLTGDLHQVAAALRRALQRDR